MDLKYFYELFEHMPRPGPGSERMTLDALHRWRARLGESPTVLDVWEASYYRPMEEQLDQLQKKYPDNAAAYEVAMTLREEIEMFRAGKGSFSYVFWLLRPR